MIGIHRANPWGRETREKGIGGGFDKNAPQYISNSGISSSAYAIPVASDTSF